MISEKTPLESLFERIRILYRENRIPFLSALITGLITYVFCFANKLETMDDLECLFCQGGTVNLGRWGLGLLDRMFPSASIPWLNGIMSLIVLSCAVCIMIRMFSIRSELFQALLAAVLISFPSHTCTFSYMYTTIQYAFSLLLAVWAASKLTKGKTLADAVLPVVMLVFSVSIYQAYIAVAAALLVAWCFVLTLDKNNSGKVVLGKGIKYIVCIVISMLVYYIINIFVQKISSTSYSAYAQNSLGGEENILTGIRVAYTSFVGYFYKGYYDLISTNASKNCHFALVIIEAFLLLKHFSEKENRTDGRLAVAALCIFLFPLSVNCIRVISTLFHNLMLFSFAVIYLLAAEVLEKCVPELKKGRGSICKDFVAIMITAVLCINVYFANAVYTKMYMQFHQAEAFYTSVFSNIMNDPDFNEDSQICFVGSNDILYDIPLIDTNNQAGIREGIVGTYSQASFIRNYLGLDLDIADWDTTDLLLEDEDVLAMPVYPYYGSIMKRNNQFIIRLG